MSKQEVKRIVRLLKKLLPEHTIRYDSDLGVVVAEFENAGEYEVITVDIVLENTQTWLAEIEIEFFSEVNEIPIPESISQHGEDIDELKVTEVELEAEQESDEWVKIPWLETRFFRARTELIHMACNVNIPHFHLYKAYSIKFTAYTVEELKAFITLRDTLLEIYQKYAGLA